MTSFSFADLNPDVILDAIESIGVYPESGLLPLNSYENRVYQFKDEEQKRYVVKFYRPQRWSNAQINEEHSFSHQLLEQGIPVVAPIVRENTSLFEHQGYRFTLFPSVGGRMFELDNLDQLEILGRLLGRFHRVSQSHPFENRNKVDFAQRTDGGTR